MYCTHCFKNLFPGDPRTAQIRTNSKEIRYVNYVMTHRPLTGWIWDKPIYVDFMGGCCATKRRVDLRILVDHPDKGLFWLCVEIDEHQHKSYAAGYEDNRYNDLFLDFSGRYVFIRLNPDSFRLGGVRHDPDIDERGPKLVDLIDMYREKGPQTDDLVEVVHLFYDGD